MPGSDPKSSAPKEGRCVKGALLLDFAKMIRANPDLPWAEHLPPEDLALVSQMILPMSWYPMEFLQRLGIAAFKLVAKESYDMLRVFGRFQADRLNAEMPGLVCQGRPRDTLNKHALFQKKFYSFELIKEQDMGPGRVIVNVFTTPEEKPGVRMMIEINMGMVERLLELSGAKNIRINTIEGVWKGDEKSAIEVKWE